MAAVIPQRTGGGGAYTFASQPRVVPQRKKYRDPMLQDEENKIPFYGNIMYDRRVIRGNTYGLHALPAHAQPDPIEVQRRQEIKRRAIARRNAKEQLCPQTPEPVDGRKHVDVQTELYLEELSDRVEEADVECQTDAFLDRPPTPLFIPAKSGIDVDTQILEGDLFNFDIEVKPILEVLVGKSVEQSLLEVMEEEELANLRMQQREFEELRNAELAEQQRLEEQERRHCEEKERRIKQMREVILLEKETAEKIAARAFAQSYLTDLVPTVFGILADNNYFYDPVEQDVEHNFIPWLMDEVVIELEKREFGRVVMDGILRDVVKKRRKVHSDLMALLYPPAPVVVESQQEVPKETPYVEPTEEEMTNEVDSEKVAEEEEKINEEEKTNEVEEKEDNEEQHLAENTENLIGENAEPELEPEQEQVEAAET